MNKVIFCCLGCAVVCLLCLCSCGGLSYLGYRNYVPEGVNLFGANAPQDLGVSYSSADLDSYYAKTNSTVELMSMAATPSESISFSGSHDFSYVTFSEAEITARVNDMQWAYAPVKDTQVQFNADGSIDVSGLLVLDNVMPFLSATGFAFPQGDIESSMDFLKIIPVDPSFYIKVIPVISENVATISIVDFRVMGGSTIDTEEYGGSAALSGLVTQIFSGMEGFYARSVTIGEGTLTFDGTAPAVVTVLPDTGVLE